MVSLFDRAGSLARGLRRKPSSKRSRREQDRRLRLVIDQLESRVALAITTPLSIGGTTVGSFTDTPTGIANLGDFVVIQFDILLQQQDIIFHIKIRRFFVLIHSHGLAIPY